MRAHKTAYLIAAVALAMSWAAPDAIAETAMHARISYESGGAMVQGTADADWSYATTNTLILPGDQLWADKGGTMEVEMAGGSFLRMADGSKVEVIDLPPSASIRGWTGAFYVQRIARSTGDFLFITPACRVEISPETHVRIDVLDEGSTTITVRWGDVEVRTDVGAPLKVTTGKRVFVDPGYLPSAPVVFDRNVEDDFDAWSRERAENLATGYEKLPAKVIETPVVGAASLASYGDWVYVDSSYYWRPTVVVDYVPYRYGYWSYVPVYGYCWVDDYPFAYVTSHYGRWHHHARYGWLWSYSPGWGPAWVASVRYGNNFVWCPLSPYNQPVIYGDLHYTVGGARFSLYASSYCVADSLLYGPAYVGACYPGIIRIGHHDDVQIWNIYAGDVTINTGRWYHGGANLRTRDYSPRRVIRGPDTIGPRSMTASARSAELQSGITRTSFSSVERTGSRMLRTPMTASSRNANLRSVAVDRSAAPTTSAAMNTAAGGRVEPVRSGVERTLSSARTVPETGDSAAETATGTSRGIRNPLTAPGVNLNRTAPSTSSGVPATPRTRVIDPDTRAVTRSGSEPAQITAPRTSLPSAEIGSRARTITDAYRPAETPQGSAPPSRSITRSGLSSRTAAPSSSATSSTTMRTPLRSAPASRSLTIGESSSPTSSPRSYRTAPSSSSSYSAPSRSMSSFRAPSISSSGPSTSTMRSAPSISRSLPSTSTMRVAPSAPAPVRSSAPSFRPSISAPSSSGSSRSFSAPARSAPSISSSPRSMSPRSR
ncbi:MAG TPA: hypothetical protein PLJ71_12960 [Candidatus Hydrogenedentes bacterium]|nr:hypothetical protein [Candidatus Hydrogenedentota bacterium]HQM49590.1 hypothetical protein [Candidatus Hydrogenedentota bacterium]